MCFLYVCQYQVLESQDLQLNELPDLTFEVDAWSGLGLPAETLFQSTFSTHQLPDVCIQGLRPRGVCLEMAFFPIFPYRQVKPTISAKGYFPSAQTKAQCDRTDAVYRLSHPCCSKGHWEQFQLMVSWGTGHNFPRILGQLPSSDPKCLACCHHNYYWLWSWSSMKKALGKASNTYL